MASPQAQLTMKRSKPFNNLQGISDDQWGKALQKEDWVTLPRAIYTDCSEAR